MEVSNEAVRQNFQSKADTQLLELAATSVGMTSGARLLLLQELQERLAKARQARETVQLIHGWYTVVAPIAGIKFPQSCPRCSRSEANSSLCFKSLEQRKFQLIYWKSDSVVSAIPHCSECAAQLKRTRTICSVAGVFLAFLWLARCSTRCAGGPLKPDFGLSGGKFRAGTILFSSHFSCTPITDLYPNRCEDTSTVDHRGLCPSPETNAFQPGRRERSAERKPWRKA